MTLQFRYGDAELRGSVLEALTVAYQDGAGIWYAYRERSADTTTRTLSVQTKHFTDWAVIAGTQIVPHTASLKVGQRLGLQVINCEFLDEDSGQPTPSPVLDCQARPFASAITDRWSVNGVEGGGTEYGTVVADPDRWTGKAIYIAPETKPTRNTVAVSARHRLIPVPDEVTFVANITIVDDDSSCSAWRNAETLDAEVSFDEFSFSATWPFNIQTGYHAGKIVGTLRKGVDVPTLPFSIWSTVSDPLRGVRVVIDDMHVHTPPEGGGYTQTLAGSDRPYEGEQKASHIILKMHHDTCTFDLFGSFWVEGIQSRDGVDSSRVLPVGGFALHGQPVPPEQLGSGFLQGALPLPLVNDTEQTGYYPAHPNVGPRTYKGGGTTARWQITRR
jgi:hypothetical protein